MKKYIFTLSICFLLLIGVSEPVSAQSCGFNAANDYVCGDAGGLPLGAHDTPGVPMNDSFQPVVRPGGGYVDRPLQPVYGDPYSSPGGGVSGGDSWSCPGTSFGDFQNHLKDREGFPLTCESRWESLYRRSGCSSPPSECGVPFVYRDSLGYPTVGVGHLVKAEDGLSVCQTITMGQADSFLASDAQWAWDAAELQMNEAGIPLSEGCFRVALASVNYQLGSAWRDKFPQTWRTIADGDYCQAADMLNGTRWQQQTPVRVADFQGALRSLGGCGGTTYPVGCASGGWTVAESERAIQISQVDDATESACARGVGNIMIEMGYPVTRGHANDWATTLPANGWVCDPTLEPQTAPPGAILTYSNDATAGRPHRGTAGGTHGHVEIVTVDSSGRRQYVSDMARPGFGGSVANNFTCAWVHPSMNADISDDPSCSPQADDDDDE